MSGRTLRVKRSLVQRLGLRDFSVWNMLLWKIWPLNNCLCWDSIHFSGCFWRPHIQYNKYICAVSEFLRTRIQSKWLYCRFIAGFPGWPHFDCDCSGAQGWSILRTKYVQAVHTYCCGLKSPVKMENQRTVSSEGGNTCGCQVLQHLEPHETCCN